MDSTEFFGGEPHAPGLEDDKDGYGRYLLDADGKGKAPYTRATTIAKMLDSGKGLEIWQQRKVAKGVAQSPALVARAAVTPLDDKQAWREILDQAEVKSGGDEKRDLGSAFHALHEHVETMSDTEWAAVPADLKATYVKYRAELKRLGITEVMTEVTVVNTKLGTAGKFDALFRLADGRLVIGDRKTGRPVEYPHSVCVQLAIYANADVMLTFNPDGSVERHPMPELDLTMAIVIDVKIGDENTASAHAYEVDIWAGWAAALLSAKIRRWRNRRDLLTPYHPEFPPTDKARNAATIEITQHPEAWAKAPTKLVPGTGVPPGSVAGFTTAAQVNATAYGDNVPGLSGVPSGYAIGAGGVMKDGPAPAAPLTAPGSVYTDGQTGGYHAAESDNVTTGQADCEPPRATPEQRAAFAAELPPSQVKMPIETAHGPAANTNTQAGHPAFSSAQQKNITVFEPHKFVAVVGRMTCGTCALGAGDAAAQHIIDRPAAPVSDDHPDVAALLVAFKTKAQLQAVLSKVDPNANLARTRANLAKDAVSHPNWPNVRTQFLALDDGEPDGRAAPGALSDPADTREEFSATVSNAPGPVPPDPEPSYPAPAADNPFVQPDPEPAPFEPAPPLALSVEDQVLQLIGEAATLDDLAAAWQTANDAGIGWPPRLHKAATIRQNQLTQ